MNRQRKDFSALGLFSGCGGLDLGASLAGFRLLGGYDNDSNSIETYKRYVSSRAEVVDLAACDLSIFPRDVDLVLGGPPCQGFSSAGPKDPMDKRNQLWKSYIRALEYIEPKAFVLENTRGFLREYPAFADEIGRVFNHTMRLDYKLINTQYYGIPQARERLFVIGIHRELTDFIPWPKPLIPEIYNWKTFVKGMSSMKSALQDLGPAEPASCLAERTWGAPHEYKELEPSHAAISPNIPNGGSLKDIPDDFLPKTYRGRTRGDKGWTYYYRKSNPYLPARTVTAAIGPCYSQMLAPDVQLLGGHGAWRWRVVDPEEFTSADGLYTSPVKQRRLTIKECARLQTFPNDFEFFGTFLEKHRQIGNAVPVRFAELLCSTIGEMLNSPGSSAKNKVESVG